MSSLPFDKNHPKISTPLVIGKSEMTKIISEETPNAKTKEYLKKIQKKVNQTGKMDSKDLEIENQKAISKTKKLEHKVFSIKPKISKSQSEFPKVVEEETKNQNNQRQLKKNISELINKKDNFDPKNTYLTQ